MLKRLLVPAFVVAFGGFIAVGCTDNSGNGKYNPNQSDAAAGGTGGGAGGASGGTGGSSGGSGGTGGAGGAGGAADNDGGTSDGLNLDLGVYLPALD